MVHHSTRHKATPHWHISGSSRLRMDVPTYLFTPDAHTSLTETTRELGHKQYEISNHLGNVLSVITDQKLPVVDATVVVSYSAVVVTATDYSPFGVGLYGRSWSGEYRYGFNTQEREPEINPALTSAEYWMYDGRLGRRWQLDPKPVTGLSDYSVLRNNPVTFNDPLGDTAIVGKSFEKSATFKQLRKEWRKQTGLKVYVNSKGHLDYSKTRKGNGSTVPSSYPKGFSATARAELLQVMSDPRAVELKEGSDTYVDRENNIIYFSAEQIENLSYVFQHNSPTMSKEAMSYGMVSYHEFDHWLNPTSNDPTPDTGMNGPGQTLMTGPTVDFENIVRSELTSAGLGNYGQRTAYYMRVGGLKVIPFDQVAKNQIIETDRLMGVQNITFAVPNTKGNTQKEVEDIFENQPDFGR